MNPEPRLPRLTSRATCSERTKPPLAKRWVRARGLDNASAARLTQQEPEISARAEGADGERGRTRELGSRGAAGAAASQRHRPSYSKSDPTATHLSKYAQGELKLVQRPGKFRTGTSNTVQYRSIPLTFVTPYSCLARYLRLSLISAGWQHHWHVPIVRAHERMRSDSTYHIPSRTQMSYILSMHAARGHYLGPNAQLRLLS